MSIILISGGCGFIGSHIVDKLINNGHMVVCIDNLSTGNIKNLNKKAEFYQRDICDNLEDLFAAYRFDYVFHTAAQINLRYSLIHPMEDAKTNIVGSLNLLENCVKYGVKKFIFSSTGGAIYDPDEPLPFTENSNASPASPYAISKLTIEKYIKFMHDAHGLDYCILRYSNVYGPRQNSKGEAGVISIFIDRAMADQELIILGDGFQTRDFVFVQNVVDANMAAMGDIRGIFNVSSNSQCSVNWLAEKIRTIVGNNIEIKHKDPVTGELMHVRLCHDKLTATTGWVPSMLIGDGILNTIDWFKQNFSMP